MVRNKTFGDSISLGTKMGDNLWPEVTQALQENKHELKLSEADVAERLKHNSLDMRIFQIAALNFLEISNVDLSELPEEIGNLGSMINLALQRNKVKEIPNTIGNLQNLKFLDISFNELTGFPTTVTNLKILHTLNLSCNKIENLPNLTNLRSLVIMHIEHNKLKSLPDGIYGLEQLMEIHASHNEITEINEDINQIESLKILDVSNNQIKDLPNQLAYCRRLKDLNLRENPLNDNRLRKMTSQCNTRAILDYVATHSGEQTKGKKGKKKKQGKGASKDNEGETSIRKIHIIRCAQEGSHVVFKDDVKDIRPYIICTVIKNLDLSEHQMYKKFIGLQTKLHDTVCDSRTKATIATHNYSSLKFPLVYTAKGPHEITIVPLGESDEVPSTDYIKKLTDQKAAEEKKKKRQQSSGVYRFLDLIKGSDVYPCLLSEDDKVVSLPPVTNSDLTKVSPSISDIFIEVTSSISLAACKEAMEKLIEQLFELGYISSQYADSPKTADGAELKGLILQQVRVELENGQLRSVFPSKIDLQFPSIPVSFVE